MISILCPTIGRSELCKRMIESARATADGELEILLGIGDDGSDIEDYYGYDITGCKVIPTGHLPSVYAANELARHATGDLLMLAADDTIFSTPHWDSALKAHYKELKNKIHVYSLQDSRDENGTPHPIATKEYVNAMGYFFTPIFLHWYVDSWMVSIAKTNGCFTHLKDYLLIHDKAADRGQPDETHNRIRHNGWKMRDDAVNASCLHFLKAEIARLRSYL
jgi:hypothetical protein